MHISRVAASAAAAASCTSALQQSLCLVVQVLSEMIISNESNILASRVLSHFNRSRQLLFTIKLRYKDLEKARALACLP